MHVFMATCAVAELNTRKFLEILVVFYLNFMAFYTFYTLVFSG
jgi:hypothetical protein